MKGLFNLANEIKVKEETWLRTAAEELVHPTPFPVLRRMPLQKPGRSRQDYATPAEFLTSVRRLLHIVDFSCDLATSAENTVCPRFYDEATDSLKQSWVVGGWAWLNPPFANIRPWVEKAVAEAALGANIALLLPASVGSAWWFDHVHGQAYAYFLRPRLTFVGETAPYIKDLALLLYAPFLAGGYATWDWRQLRGSAK